MNATSDQLAAVTSTAPLTFVVAGPGSGKTRTLIWRIEHLLREDVSPATIVAITFTNAAAREIEHRLANGGNHDRLGFVGTLHSFMLKLLRAHHALVNYGPHIGVLTEEEGTELIDQIVADQKYNGTVSDLTNAIAAGPPSLGTRLTKAQLTAAAFYQTLRRSNLMTFDSILIYGEFLLRAMRPTILSKDQSWQFSHYLIDEAQDSSAMDMRIYGALVGDRYFVGDPDQSIYAFRGADVSQCLNVAKVAKVITLEDNFRCGSAICTAAQRLIEHNQKRHPKVTRSATGFSGLITYTECSTPAAEACYVIQEIQKSTPLPSDIAVLVRTNDLVREFSDHLRGAGIPVSERIVKPRPADFPAARLFLMHLNNPEDDYSTLRAVAAIMGPDAAQELKLRAAQSMQSCNEAWRNHTRPTIEELGEFMGSFQSDTQKLIAAAISDLSPDADLSDVILALNSQYEGEEFGEGVTVTTCHSAKGREWRVVFLPAFEQEMIPGTRKSMDIEEERRLAYVAMTRAKEELVISRSLKRVPKWGKPVLTETHPSQFIAEAGIS